MASYRQVLEGLRQAFPAPVSDRVHDAYFVFSFLRALDQVDALKSVSPMLGQPCDLDYAAARQARLADDSLTLESVSRELVGHLSGMFIPGHPRSQINVVPPPTIPSIIGGLLPSIYNPNLVSDESGRGASLAEVEAVAMTAALLGYDPERAGGVFTFGGTATTLYGARIGLETACPGSFQNGLREPAVIVASAQGHYAAKTVAAWLGLGLGGFVPVPTDNNNEIRIADLETALRQQIESGKKIAAIIATLGTTDAFGLDDLDAMHALRARLVDEYRLEYVPHLHADAVIGWAWGVFSDYDFSVNPLAFRGRTVRALAHTRRRVAQLHLADSIGIDFHKTGFAPYVSSLVLTRERSSLERLARSPESMPYLFQSGRYHPGQYTLETTRAGSGPMAALANLRLFGKNGLRSLLGHLVSMAEGLREQLEGNPATHVLNGGNYGPVTLFRAYPDGVDTFTVPHRERTDPAYKNSLVAHNEYNRALFQRIQAEALQGQGVVLSLTDCYRTTDYGEPIVALKSYIMSPFAEEQSAHSVLESVMRARAALAAQV